MNATFCLTQIYCKPLFILGISIIISVSPCEAGCCYAGPVDDSRLIGLEAAWFLKVFFYVYCCLVFSFVLEQQPFHWLLLLQTILLLDS